MLRAYDRGMAGRSILLAFALIALPACAPTVPLAQYESLEAKLAELEAGQEALRTEMGSVEDANQQLTAMVAAQRQIIRDLRCRSDVTIEGSD